MNTLFFLLITLRNPYSFLESLFSSAIFPSRGLYKTAVIVGGHPSAHDDLLNLISSLDLESTYIVFVNNFLVCSVKPNLIIYEVSDDFLGHQKKIMDGFVPSLQSCRLVLHSSFANLKFRSSILKLFKSISGLTPHVISRSNFPYLFSKNESTLASIMRYVYQLPCINSFAVWYRCSIASISFLLAFKSNINHIFIVGSPMTDDLYNGLLLSERLSAVRSVKDCRRGLSTFNVKLSVIVNDDSPLYI